MNPLFQDKTVLVTGAAAGIGHAIALAAAGEGAKLILGDVDVARLEATAAELKQKNVGVVFARCDVREQAEIDDLLARGEAELGPVHTAYANAGVLGSPAELWKYPEDAFREVMEINVTGTWRTLRAVLPGMIERQAGAVVATSSAGGLIGAAGLSAYVASKHAIIGLVRSAALEVGSMGIRVNALCPHMTDTAMLDRVADDLPGLRDALMEMNPSKRLGTPEEVAQAAIWLGSDNAGYVNGHPLLVDGGYLAQ